MGGAHAKPEQLKQAPPPAAPAAPPPNPTFVFLKEQPTADEVTEIEAMEMVEQDEIIQRKNTNSLPHMTSGARISGAPIPPRPQSMKNVYH